MELILGSFGVFTTREGQKRDRPERLVVRQLDVSHWLLDDCTLETLIKIIHFKCFKQILSISP